MQKLNIIVIKKINKSFTGRRLTDGTANAGAIGKSIGSVAAS